jgi:hypothetical protein
MPAADEGLPGQPIIGLDFTDSTKTRSGSPIAGGLRPYFPNQNERTTLSEPAANFFLATTHGTDARPDNVLIELGTSLASGTKMRFRP